jgi:hypothetical protein
MAQANYKTNKVNITYTIYFINYTMCLKISISMSHYDSLAIF